MKRIIFGAILGWIAFCFYTGKITVAEVIANYETVKANIPANTLPNTSFSRVDIPFYYDDTNAPRTVSQSRFLEAVDKANDAWGHACNIHFKYMGTRSNDYSSRNRGDAGMIRWGSFDSDGTLGETTQGSTRGPAMNFNMTLSADKFADARYMVALNHVMIHELGHAIAFDHSQNSKSIMYWQVTVGGDIINRLNANDEAACQYYRHRWAGMSPRQASEKAGIMVDE